MASPPRHILFLCTHNSARSILAEALATQLGQGRLQGHSAGSQPSGRVHPLALTILAEMDCRTTDLHSKSWTAFAGPGAMPMDIVITVCDSAFSEPCPAWPGRPATAHWSCRDPSWVEGDAQARMQAFRHAAELMSRRLQRLLALPLETMETVALRQALDEIGRQP